VRFGGFVGCDGWEDGGTFVVWRGGLGWLLSRVNWRSAR